MVAILLLLLPLLLLLLLLLLPMPKPMNIINKQSHFQTVTQTAQLIQNSLAA
jgi:hypothetical protein